MAGKPERRAQKKLIEAAEHWARGGREQIDEAISDLDAFGGAPPEIAEGLRARAEPTEFEVHPDNWETVMLFQRIQTQWIQGPGGATGLNYPSVFATMDRLAVKDPDGALFAGLQVMERAALEASA